MNKSVEARVESPALLVVELHKQFEFKVVTFLTRLVLEGVGAILAYLVCLLGPFLAFLWGLVLLASLLLGRDSVL